MPSGSDRDLRVNDHLVIPAAELEWSFGRSGGPGGQHANTADTRAEVRFDIAGSSVLSEGQRSRLTQVFGNEIRVGVSDERSQSRNRAIALERLGNRLADALVQRRRRVATRPKRGAVERRLSAKARRSEVKRGRGRIDPRRDQ